MSVVVINGERIQAKLDKLSRLDTTHALNEACLVVETAAKENCPVDDGQLRNSIKSDVDAGTDSGTVGSNLEYAPYVHQGTGIFATDGNGRQDRWSYKDAKGEWHSTIGQRPNPFLTKALEDNKDKILDIFKDEVKENLK